MCEYIKREYAVDAVLDVYYDTPDIDLSGEKFEAAILKIQAADVAPVRHGRWVKMDTTGLLAVEPVWNCSSCGYPVGVSVAGSKYCPNCGCIMDLEV